MACYLRLLGNDLDVDAMAKEFDITPETAGIDVKRRGESLVPGMKADDKRVKTSSLQVCISAAGFREFEKQIEDSIESLREDFEFIQGLRAFDGVERAILDFGIAWNDTVTQTDRLPSELLRLAGELELDIHISHYPVAPVHNENSNDSD